MQSYDIWKLDTPPENEEDCCENPDVIGEFQCGCVHCENCDWYSECRECHKMNMAGF